MEHLKMKTADMASENFEKLKALFPNCVTESLDKDGNPVRAIDKDLLMQEINSEVVEGQKERYQFNWPGKRDAIRKANAPTTMTLRPCKDESVDFDNTQNLYIEGDNLEVLKLLQNNYLGKVKMIYIDPPYNTGNDFVYNDNFKQNSETFLETSGMFDEDGNMTLQNFQKNSESEGLFHTKWLNMIYPRLKVARNLLSDDGAIFISIDDNELNNLKRLCDEIFGSSNFRNTILTRRRIKSLNSQFAENGLSSMNVAFEYILVYAKTSSFLMKALQMQKTNASEKGRWDVFWSGADRPTMRYELLGFTPSSGQWRNSKEKADRAVSNYQKYLSEYQDKMSLEEYYKRTGIKEFIRRIPNATGKNGGVQHWVAPSDSSLRTSNWTDIEVSQIGKEIDLPFDNPKSKRLVMELIQLAEFKKVDIILDFFSGSATTAHAVMQLNAEDNGNRKYICVQLPEATAEDSEAYKAGYKNICEIGKERIRRAGKKIKDETGLTAQNLDIGFRVLKLAESNMNDVYYKPADIDQGFLDKLDTNIKRDRTPMDLLFQVMLECDLELSSKIEEREINGKKVFFVNDKELVACFDENIDETTITEIAKLKPYYFVMRDSSLATDNVADNFEQLWNAYSKDTIRKVL